MKIYSGKRPKKKSDEYLFLESINWNDYSYESSFELYYYNGAREIYVGELKVIDENIDVGSVEISTNNEKKLSSNLCSLGQTESYYRNLKKLKDEDSTRILKALNDCASNDFIYEHFKGLEQFKSSAVRFSTAEKALKFGKEIFSRDRVNVVEPCHSFTFNSLLKGFDKNHKLNFKFFDKETKKIPANINVLIGRNGTGKTQLLSDLAKTISGYGFENKEELIQSRDTKFGNSNPSFGNVIVISYSAFDNFEIPGKDQQEKDELASVGHVHGYKYCGLRERINDNQYRLKDISEISEEFTTSYKKIKKDGVLNEWFECISHVLSDPSFQCLNKLNLQKSFKKLSSGQKIILSILAGVYEHIDNNSLIVLDEPETHLHPSLMSAFMHSLRDILSRFDSYAVIATHSPVILQETPSLFVQVLGGSSRNPRVNKLRSESFGEEISTLTEDVFHVSYEESNFYKTLTDLSEQGYSSDEIDELFEKRLGFTAKSFIESL
ncbi:AAA family ATPase [Vibrio scophthalmi]|uniref:AAA family ATPase n=1 Tax=Vibrio scophthalmi TaxID=45658 RepID=UPI0022844938|nr:AAA family ATPase [Vibrio scophthalmi]MCY9802677.1 AAA family ATPase [Vibrio scophthalmi]